MKGPYIIGIYGRKKSTYTISLTSETYPMAMLMEGLPLKKVQETFEIAYYQFYNWQEEDLKITIDVRNGYADLYVATYDDNN